MPLGTMMGNAVDGTWREWTTNWGQTVLIPGGMRVRKDADGGWLAFPQGDESAPACAKMPESGYFFDAVIRQEEFDEDDPDVADNTEEYQPLSDADIARTGKAAREAAATGGAVVAGLPGTAIGDIAFVPGMALKRPKGIRDVAEWYMSTVSRPEFLHQVFERQTDVAIANLERLAAEVGDAYDVVFVCGTDFGTQVSTFCSKDTLRDLYLPYYKRLNDWIHANTPWKTWKHSCGAIEGFVETFIEAGFDVLNPVQCSATGMDPEHLKRTYGDRIVFWGAGVDTQRVLPFGTPAEVRAQVLERCRIFSPGGGFIFNAIHNVQARTPTANMVALLDAVKEFNAAGK
jgi:hypothetical protein